jgi:hypothetical protein
LGPPQSDPDDLAVPLWARIYSNATSERNAGTPAPAPPPRQSRRVRLIRVMRRHEQPRGQSKWARFMGRLQQRLEGFEPPGEGAGGDPGAVPRWEGWRGRLKRGERDGDG